MNASEEDVALHAWAVVLAADAYVDSFDDQAPKLAALVRAVDNYRHVRDDVKANT